MAKNVPKEKEESDSDSEEVEQQVKKEIEKSKKNEEVERKLKEMDEEKENLKKELLKKAEENLCIICEEQTINMCFVPCGHQIICSDCSAKQEAKNDNVCPNCRALITLRIKTFGR